MTKRNNDGNNEKIGKKRLEDEKISRNEGRMKEKRMKKVKKRKKNMEKSWG